VDDDAIRNRIKIDFGRSGYVWDPHSATAAEAYARMSQAQRGPRAWILAATAHPYKFADVVEPVIGEKVAPPPALQSILGRKARKAQIPAGLQALALELKNAFGSVAA
jgi:threonine synthase